MSGPKLPAFDTDEDRAVDEALKNGQQVDATVPPDLEAAIPGAPPVPRPEPINLAELSDDQLAMELARRRTNKIDAKILECRAVLAALETERDALAADPGRIFDPTAFMVPQIGTVAPVTQINPITGKAKRVKPLPGSVNPKDCTCEGGCYMCQTKGITTAIGAGVPVDRD